MDLELAAKVVLITGGTDGLGLALAIRLAQEGGAVAICGRDADRLAEAQASVQAAGGEVLARDQAADRGVPEVTAIPSENGTEIIETTSPASMSCRQCFSPVRPFCGFSAGSNAPISIGLTPR